MSPPLLPKKKKLCDPRFEVLTVVLINIKIFQDVTKHQLTIYQFPQ
jgi:hypothetical protein